MRIVQRIFLYGIAVVFALAGVAIAAYPFNEKAGQLAGQAAQLSENWMWCVLIGIAIAAIGIFTLLPFNIFRKKGRAISFAGPSGTLEIQLDSFEASLQKTVSKLPMVKRAHITVTPEDSNRKVGIDASVSLKKPADLSTRETGERLEEFILKAARNILGADEVTQVVLRVSDIQVDSTQTAESLNSIFADAEKSVAASLPTGTASPSYAPAATAVAAASAGAAAVAPEDVAAEEPYTSDIDDDSPYTAAATEQSERHKSSELLSYEESEALQQASGTDLIVDDEDEPLPPMESTEEAPSETAFESLSEEASVSSPQTDGEHAEEEKEPGLQ